MKAELRGCDCSCREASAHWTSKVKLSGPRPKVAREYVFRSFPLKPKKTWKHGWKSAPCLWAAGPCSSTQQLSSYLCFAGAVRGRGGNAFLQLLQRSDFGSLFPQ